MPTTIARGKNVMVTVPTAAMERNMVPIEAGVAANRGDWIEGTDGDVTSRDVVADSAVAAGIVDPARGEALLCGAVREDVGDSACTGDRDAIVMRGAACSGDAAVGGRSRCVEVVGIEAIPEFGDTGGADLTPIVVTVVSGTGHGNRITIANMGATQSGDAVQKQMIVATGAMAGRIGPTRNRAVVAGKRGVVAGKTVGRGPGVAKEKDVDLAVMARDGAARAAMSLVRPVRMTRASQRRATTEKMSALNPNSQPISTGILL